MSSEVESGDSAAATADLRASLVLRDFELPVVEVTRLIGIEPTHAGEKGQQRVNTRGRLSAGRNKHNFWMLGSGASSSATLVEHVRSILEKVESATPGLNALPDEVSRRIYCTIIPDGPLPLLELSSDVMCRLAGFNCDLTIDVLSMADTESE